MESLLQQLERYLETTPEDQLLRDWAESSKYDEGGISVDKFLEINGYHLIDDNYEKIPPEINLINTNKEKSECYSDFFFTFDKNNKYKIYESCRLFTFRL